MTTFNFAEAANTTLQTIDAKWTETTTGHTVTDGSGNAWSSASPNSFTARYAWFPNSQGNTQESEIDVLAHPAGSQVYAVVQKTAGQNGYRLWLPASGQIELRRNDVYLADAGGTGVDPAASNYTLKITYNVSTGVVTGYLNGVAKVSYTDSSPLTGGYPGFYLYGNGETTNRPKVSRFTDNVATGPVITGTSSATPSNGSSMTVSGINFGASKGTKVVKIGGTVCATTAWSDTSFTVTIDRGLNKYGVAVNVEVWDTVLVSNSFALTSLLPQAGWSFVNIASISGTGLTALPSLVAGDQVAYQSTVSSAGDVVVDTATDFAAASGVTSFQCEAWTTTDGWGAVATQTVRSGSSGRRFRGRVGGWLTAAFKL